MLEKLQKQTKHSTICHVKKKDPKKELQKEGWLEKRKHCLLIASHVILSIFHTQSRTWLYQPSYGVASFHLSLIFCFGTPWQHSLLFCNDSSCQPYIMMLKDMRFYLQGFTWRTCLQEGCSCLLHWSKEGFLAYFLGSCRIVKNVCFYVASIQRCIIFYLLPLLSWR